MALTDTEVAERVEDALSALARISNRLTTQGDGDTASRVLQARRELSMLFLRWRKDRQELGYVSAHAADLVTENVKLRQELQVAIEKMHEAREQAGWREDG